jgi:death-on-curing protein
LATSHPFRDGNNRVAFLTMALFIELNGQHLEVPEEDVVRVMLAVAGGRCSEQELAGWVRNHLGRRK